MLVFSFLSENTGRSMSSYSRKRMRPYASGQQSWRAKKARIYGSKVYPNRPRYGRRGRNPALRNLRTGGLLGIETKYLDVAISGVAITAPTDASGGEIQPTGGCTGCLSAPAQGDGAQERDGKKIVIKSALIQGGIYVPAQTNQTGADVAPVVFLALVKDTQTNGVTINSEDVFTNPAGNAGSGATPFRNMSNSSRFQVLKQWRQRLTQPNMVFDGTNIEQGGFNYSFVLSWKGICPVNFSTTATTANVSAVIDNSLHLIAYSNTTNLTPTINACCRIRFVG